MTSLQQIKKVHDAFGHADTLPDYLHALHAIGVLSYDSLLSDGHSQYYCESSEKLNSEAVHAKFAVADSVDKNQFLRSLRLHEEGKIDYFEMSEALAASGVERWRFDTVRMNITYLDKAGNVLLRERIGS